MSRNASKVYKISFNFDINIMKCIIQSYCKLHNYMAHSNIIISIWLRKVNIIFVHNLGLGLGLGFRG